MNKARAPGAVFMHLKARSEGKCDMKLPHVYMGQLKTKKQKYQISTVQLSMS